MHGYRCDVPDCEQMSEDTEGILTLDLNEMALSQAAEVYVGLVGAGVVEHDDVKYGKVTRYLQGEAPADVSFPTVRVDLCAAHVLTVIQNFGIALAEHADEDPEEELETITEDDDD